jgi:small GTP-binding protein
MLAPFSYLFGFTFSHRLL